MSKLAWFFTGVATGITLVTFLVWLFVKLNVTSWV